MGSSLTHTNPLPLYAQKAHAIGDNEGMALHELAERTGNGITVRLWWESDTDDVTVTYVDDRQGESFTLYPPRDKAMDAFDHPNAWPESARQPRGVNQPLPQTAVF